MGPESVLVLGLKRPLSIKDSASLSAAPKRLPTQHPAGAEGGPGLQSMATFVKLHDEPSFMFEFFYPYSDGSRKPVFFFLV